MTKYPFKFLDAYDLNDTDIFFGRDEETAALYEMVFQTSIILVYGASGTGKTSLIQCGLASKFQPHDWLSLVIRRGANINATLEKVLTDAGGNLYRTADDSVWLEQLATGKDAGPPGAGQSPLAQSFKAIYLNSFRPIYLVFDQFEELYILGNKEEEGKFIETVCEILKIDQPIKIIFSIREEYLGHLYEFERAVPQLMQKKLRVEPMNYDKVNQVIIGATSYKYSNVKLDNDKSSVITKEIFDKIKSKEKTLSIQLPYLQVFLDKLYLEITGDATRQATATITADAVSKIGDIGDVLRNFLEEQVKNISQSLSKKYVAVTIEIIWKILSPFATLEGTKEPISIQYLLDQLPALNESLVRDTVQSFVNNRILRYLENDDLYEIAHDSLALRIAEKRSDEEIALLEVRRLIESQTSIKEDAREWFTEKQLNFIEPYLPQFKLNDEESKLIKNSYKELTKQKNKRRRRFQITIAVLTGAVAVMTWLTILAYQEKEDALRMQKRAIASFDATVKALESLKKTQALARAKELEAFGDSYLDLGKTEFACASYRAALDTLKLYINESLFVEITKKAAICK